MEPPEICPHCGADVPPNARACPECGSDEKTGWSEQAKYDRLGIPSDEFDYDEFIKDEFDRPAPSQLHPKGIPFFWWLVAIALLLLFLLPFLQTLLRQ